MDKDTKPRIRERSREKRGKDFRYGQMFALPRGNQHHLAKHVTLASAERAKLCKIRLRVVEAGKLHLGNEIACVSDLIEKIGKLRVLWGGQSR